MERQAGGQREGGADRGDGGADVDGGKCALSIGRQLSFKKVQNLTKLFNRENNELEFEWAVTKSNYKTIGRKQLSFKQIPTEPSDETTEATGNYFGRKKLAVG